MFLVPKFDSYPDIKGPAYSFFVEHETSGSKILFDLGIRKDHENLPAKVQDLLKSGKGWGVSVEKNVVDILVENGVDPGSIKDIIWSHRHWDHLGDPSTFPPKTSLTVGPGFKEKVGKGYPHEPESTVEASAWQNREFIELDFGTDSRASKIGKYRAIDYFGDGSFYLLESPGHTVDHMCGFARTKTASSAAEKDEFILMGGDIAHHGGEYKPSKYAPIPEQIEPDPRRPPWSGGLCPGHIFADVNQANDGDAKWTAPYFRCAPNFPDNLDQAQWSLSVLEEFDVQDNIFVVFAHDPHLLDVIEFFPKPATGWKEKGWKKEGNWRFLTDFKSDSSS